MNTVVEAFLRLIPSRHKRTGSGWITFDCPSPTCGDRRGRGGFKETANGFRYRCLNGGCEWETSTGWEPDRGFYGRPRRLFEQMDGDINDIPIEAREARTPRPRDPTADLEIAKDFPQVSPPEGSRLIWEHTDNQHIRDAQQYVLRRGLFFVEYPFLWSPNYRRHVIYPFCYHRKTIGWIARKIDAGKQYAHIKCPNFPTDYMLNQEYAYKNKNICLVQEGAFDAAALRSLCTFGNTISKKQINFLNQVKARGRKVVLLPDFQKEEWMPYWQAAKDNGWYLSVPKWPGSSPIEHIKDAGDSIKRNGLLLTVETIMDAITDDYVSAKMKLNMWSREAIN